MVCVSITRSRETSLDKNTERGVWERATFIEIH